MPNYLTEEAIKNVEQTKAGTLQKPQLVLVSKGEHVSRKSVFFAFTIGLNFYWTTYFYDNFFLGQPILAPIFVIESIIAFKANLYGQHGEVTMESRKKMKKVFMTQLEAGIYL